MKNLTPKETAEQLVEKYSSLDGNYNSYPYDKQCALICVDEILKENERINEGGLFPTPLTEWWKQVKQQIELL
jgi:hypothetical protein